LIYGENNSATFALQMHGVTDVRGESNPRPRHWRMSFRALVALPAPTTPLAAVWKLRVMPELMPAWAARATTIRTAPAPPRPFRAAMNRDVIRRGA
jgi:hypothetical protein